MDRAAQVSGEILCVCLIRSLNRLDVIHQDICVGKIQRGKTKPGCLFGVTANLQR